MVDAQRVAVLAHGRCGGLVEKRAHVHYDGRAVDVALLHLSPPQRMAAMTEASQAPLAVERAASREVAMMAAWLGRQAVAPAVVEGWKVEKQAHERCDGRDLA